MAKKIKHIGVKRALLSEIFNIRNRAVRALDEDNEDLYNQAVVKLYEEVHRLEAA